jgi:ABC-type methionine transport system ATPase subunit
VLCCVSCAAVVACVSTIARALSNDPELLLLDEPTGDLDTRNTVDIMDLLLRINLEKRTTCLMVTHNPDLEGYADRILYVQDGTFLKQAVNEVQSRLGKWSTTDHHTTGHHSHFNIAPNCTADRLPVAHVVVPLPYRFRFVYEAHR